MSVPQPDKDYEKWPQEHHAHGNGNACPRCFQLGVRQGEQDGKMEVAKRLRDTLLHPSVKDKLIPVSIWHLLRNLEHETGIKPIGL